MSRPSVRGDGRRRRGTTSRRDQPSSLFSPQESEFSSYAYPPAGDLSLEYSMSDPDEPPEDQTNSLFDVAENPLFDVVEKYLTKGGLLYLSSDEESTLLRSSDTSVFSQATTALDGSTITVDSQPSRKTYFPPRGLTSPGRRALASSSTPPKRKISSEASSGSSAKENGNDDTKKKKATLTPRRWRGSAFAKELTIQPDNNRRNGMFGKIIPDRRKKWPSSAPVIKSEYVEFAKLRSLNPPIVEKSAETHVPKDSKMENVKPISTKLSKRTNIPTSKAGPTAERSSTDIGFAKTKKKHKALDRNERLVSPIKTDDSGIMDLNLKDAESFNNLVADVRRQMEELEKLSRSPPNADVLLQDGDMPKESAPSETEIVFEDTGDNLWNNQNLWERWTPFQTVGSTVVPKIVEKESSGIIMNDVGEKVTAETSSSDQETGCEVAHLGGGAPDTSVRSSSLWNEPKIVTHTVVEFNIDTDEEEETMRRTEPLAMFDTETEKSCTDSSSVPVSGAIGDGTPIEPLEKKDTECSGNTPDFKEPCSCLAAVPCGDGAGICVLKPKTQVATGSKRGESNGEEAIRNEFSVDDFEARTTEEESCSLTSDHEGSGSSVKVPQPQGRSVTNLLGMVRGRKARLKKEKAYDVVSENDPLNPAKLPLTEEPTCKTKTYPAAMPLTEERTAKTKVTTADGSEGIELERESPEGYTRTAMSIHLDRLTAVPGDSDCKPRLVRVTAQSSPSESGLKIVRGKNRGNTISTSDRGDGAAVNTREGTISVHIEDTKTANQRPTAKQDGGKSDGLPSKIERLATAKKRGIVLPSNRTTPSDKKQSSKVSPDTREQNFFCGKSIDVNSEEPKITSLKVVPEKSKVTESAGNKKEDSVKEICRNKTQTRQRPIPEGRLFPRLTKSRDRVHKSVAIPKTLQPSVPNIKGEAKLSDEATDAQTDPDKLRPTMVMNKHHGDEDSEYETRDPKSSDRISACDERIEVLGPLENKGKESSKKNHPWNYIFRKMGRERPIEDVSVCSAASSRSSDLMNDMTPPGVQNPPPMPKKNRVVFKDELTGRIAGIGDPNEDAEVRDKGIECSLGGTKPYETGENKTPHASVGSGKKKSVWALLSTPINKVVTPKSQASAASMPSSISECTRARRNILLKCSKEEDGPGEESVTESETVENQIVHRLMTDLKILSKIEKKRQKRGDHSADVRVEQLKKSLEFLNSKRVDEKKQKAAQQGSDLKGKDLKKTPGQNKSTEKDLEKHDGARKVEHADSSDPTFLSFSPTTTEEVEEEAGKAVPGFCALFDEWGRFSCSAFI